MLLRKEGDFMEASPMSLFEKFIKEAYGSQYVIPVYQRNYTWKKNKQVKQLLNDIENILTGETKKHFIGTIVYNIVKTDFMVRERSCRWAATSYYHVLDCLCS